MTEYIIIVVLIIIAAIGVYSFFGEPTRSPATGVSQELSDKKPPGDARQAGKPGADVTKEGEAR